MATAYCNTSSAVVRTCDCQLLRQALFVGLLFFVSHGASAQRLSKSPAVSVTHLDDEVTETAAFTTNSNNVGTLQNDARALAALTEKKRQNPADTAVAVEIKTIGDRKATIVQVAVQSAARFPDSDKVQRAAGAVAIQAGDYKMGLAYADRAVSLAEAKIGDPGALAAALRVRATGSLRSGDYPKAAEDAARILKAFPGDRDARSIYEMSQGRTKGGGAATARDRPLSNAPVERTLFDDPRLREAGRRAGDRADAIKRAAQAMSRIDIGDGAAALAAANAAVAADPTLADGYMTRGLAYMLLKEFASALREFTKAIDLWSAQGKRENLPVAYGRRAEAGNESKAYPDALRDAQRAVEADAGLGLGYLERARAREGLGEKGENILADFKRAAELAPQYAAQYASASVRLSEGAPAPARRRPSRDRLLAVAAGAWALCVLLAFLVWRASRRARTGAGIGFADERKELNSQYDITGTLGEGGMGVVYKGWDKALKRPVAVKKLRGELQDDPRARDRFLKEAEMVASLHHPHIVDIYTIIRDAADTYLVFEYVSGMTLHELLDESPGRRLAPARALEILRQIGEAVDHAHARHVIHRDLKPANVMLADGGWVKVMDFGIARQVLDSLLTTTNTIAGTPVYMAPEQAAGAAVKESDVFALGVTLYELLTGALPFGGPGEMSGKLESRFEAPSALVPGLGRAIDEVVSKALSPRPEDRYRRCADLYQAAARAFNVRATPAGPR